jgi:hypothetical protein
MPPKKSPIVKVLAWENPGPLGGPPRWDMEIIHADGTRSRVVGVTNPIVKRLMECATAAVVARKS